MKVSKQKREQLRTMYMRVLSEWLDTPDGRRLFKAWSDPFRVKGFTAKQFGAWTGDCPEFQTYLKQRIENALDDRKRRGEIYETPSGRFYATKP